VNYLAVTVSYIVAHQAQIAGIVAAIIALGRVLAPVLRPLAPKFPRIAHVIVAIRHVAPDVVPALAALWRAVTGAPFPLALPVPVVVATTEGESSK
jgi:hypothetical protein